VGGGVTSVARNIVGTGVRLFAGSTLGLVILHGALQGTAAAGEDDPPAIAARPVPAAGSRDAYRGLLRQEAARAGLPPDVADAVTEVESSYDPGTVGADGEIGLMQVLPSTARMLGFAGTLDELAVPETNIRYGVTYLAAAWRLAGGDICTAAMKYRAGHGETRFSYRSVEYCLRVRAKLFARGYPVTGAVPVATFGEPMPGGGGGRRIRLVAGPALDFNALNSRLRAVATQAAAQAVRLGP